MASNNDLLSKVSAMSILLLYSGFAFSTVKPEAFTCWDDLSQSSIWIDTGGIIPSGISIDAFQNNIWFAYYEDHKHEIHVLIWDGSRWKKLPIIKGGITGAYNPQLVVGSDGFPIISWGASGKNQSFIYVATLINGNWKMLGEPLSGIAEAFTHSGSQVIKLDNTNKPVVVWHERQAGGKHKNLYAARWNGKSWKMLGDYIAINSTIYDLAPSLFVDGNTYYVSWNGGDKEESYVAVAKWDGKEWKSISGNTTSLNNGNLVMSSNVIVDSTNKILVSWIERGANKNHFLAHLEKGKWSTINQPKILVYGDYTTFKSLLNINKGGETVLAWIAVDSDEIANIYLEKYRNNVWTPIFTKFQLNGGLSHVINLTFSMTWKNNFVIAWQELNYERKSRIRIIETRKCSGNEKSKQIPVNSAER